MNPKAIKTLEFDKILNILETYCSTYLGRALVHNTNISSKKDIIQKRLNETTQVQELIIHLGNIPLTEIKNISLSLKKCNIGGTLSCEELLNVGHNLKLVQDLKTYINENKHLSNSDILIYFNNLLTFKNIEDLIFANILDEETINDKASTELNSIRKNIRQKENKIRDTLSNYISSPTYSKYIQDAIITIKNGRFVIPVKQEYKNNIKGLIHDTSSSGSTLFVEPNNIVSMNNDIKELQLQEEKEIAKILFDYSQKINSISEEIQSNLQNIGQIDYLSAKAKYSLKYNMFQPNLSENKYINLINAKHPLIDTKKVVPISLEISNNFNCMIITGPNTGGKTVTLKTIGLLTLIAQYGMHIPAGSNSTICIFNEIYTDIGDEQSIEQNLSTFSSHMTNIISITEKADTSTLVIVDELGSGTDPVEGAALAIGILEYFNELNCLTICSTHYSELKTYAMSKSNILNASTEFNIKTLKPTFKLRIGIPGKSNAFAISEKLGLSKDILATSSKYINKSSFDFENVLTKISLQQDEAEKIKKNIQTEYSKIKTNSEYLEKEKLKLENEKEALITNAKAEAQSIILNAKNEMNELLNEIYASKNESSTDIQKNKTKINEKTNKDLNKLTKLESVDSNKIKIIDIKDLCINQIVFIKSLQKEAKIISISKKGIKVQLDNISTNIDIKDIDLLNNINAKKNSNIKFSLQTTSKNIPTSINVMGLTVDESIYEIDKYLDSAYVAHLGIITILHGKGTGKLKSAIHSYLKDNKYVKSYRFGGYAEGQDGVTIVEIK